MRDIHDIVNDEATIKIVSSKTDVLQMAPDHLKKPYWVCLEEGGNYLTSFGTLEEAIQFIINSSLANGKGIQENS